MYYRSFPDQGDACLRTRPGLRRFARQAQGKGYRMGLP